MKKIDLIFIISFLIIIFFILSSFLFLEKYINKNYDCSEEIDVCYNKNLVGFREYVDCNLDYDYSFKQCKNRVERGSVKNDTKNMS